MTPTEHVKLHDAPLKKMLVQLRYPAEFGFAASLVRPLQKALASRFPVASGEQFIAGVTVGIAVNSEIKASPPVEFKQVFRFSTLDGSEVVQVTEDFIAYETTRYYRFANFISAWSQVIRLAIEKLELRTQLRLGLRYSNVVARPEITTVEGWQGLIADHLLMSAMDSGSVIDAHCFLARHELRFSTPHGSCALHHGFAAPTEPGDQAAGGYVLDIDSYDETAKSIDVEEQLGTLAHWNHQTYRLLRRSVSDDLWKSFRPGELDAG